MGTKIKAMTTIDAQDFDGLLKLSKSQLTTPNCHSGSESLELTSSNPIKLKTINSINGLTLKWKW